jgi:hypothetical protein
MDKIAEHALDFWISAEDLPDPNNRVTVDQAGQIHLHYTPNNQTAIQRLTSRLTDLLDRLYLRNHLVERQIRRRKSFRQKRHARSKPRSGGCNTQTVDGKTSAWVRAARAAQSLVPTAPGLRIGLCLEAKNQNAHT